MYSITKANLQNEHESYTAYGIAIDYSDHTEIIALDISTDKAFVQDIVNKCNACNASREHILDIIEDFISQ